MNQIQIDRLAKLCLNAPRTMPSKGVIMSRIFAYMTGACLVAATASAAQGDEFPWLTERKILGTNNLEAIEAAAGTPVYEYSRAIARVEVSEDAYPFCTATRVGEGVFLTNWHCDRGCDTMQFRLGYEKDRPPSEQRVYKCKALLRTNNVLDYSLYTAELLPDAPTLPTLASETESIQTPETEVRYPVLALSRIPLTVGLAVAVPQHPTGRFKEVDRSSDCVISDVEVFHTESGRDTIKHMCDTQGGSSGAPVIEQATGYVVALHWGGRDDEFNMAIPMGLIVDDLAQNLAADVLSQVHVVTAAPAD